ncbi:cyclopropane-fatty-acyl-phospholipid synthase [Pontibaca methylaminivorans]|uniref:Cyclopropane-fatty-acyl-phospholipid synthase n=2 Tax=Pontibaca methylaminivorans TaxID=515897 RepID=A0A1R3WC70_9RHOB|nr:cyclopropane-fatty-acyl-phospholipid synthase [Pontibaca methylaminivorans]
MLFSAILRSFIQHGSLEIIRPNGHRLTFGDGTPPHVAVRLSTGKIAATLFRNPALVLGEAYMDGRLIIAHGSIYDFLDLLAQNLSSSPGGFWYGLSTRTQRVKKRATSIRRARRNVAHHYDLDARLYDLFLDDDKQYSCAYFRKMDDGIDLAQLQKKQHIAAKLYLDQPGLRVLDIGCGWGGMACYLAENFEAEVTGITLSQEQYEYCLKRAENSPARVRIDFRMLDYRELAEPYDRIVSVGMFEHVGKRSYPEFFAQIRNLLTEDGIALIHAIGFSDTPSPMNPFMRKYIFPGADVASLSEVFSVVEPSGLLVTDLEILRLHYAETLLRWRQRFTAQREKAVQLYDEKFYRMWEFYLAMCEVGFRRQALIVFQIQLAKQIDRLPITRDYMFETEREWTSEHRAQ